MNKWNIKISDVVDYQVEARTEQEAIEQALEWWAERMPVVEARTAETTRQEIWEEVLEDVCGCYEDEVGNRPCDWGAMCDKCRAPWVQEIYKGKLKEKGLAD